MCIAQVEIRFTPTNRHFDCPSAFLKIYKSLRAIQMPNPGWEALSVYPVHHKCVAERRLVLKKCRSFVKNIDSTAFVRYTVFNEHGGSYGNRTRHYGRDRSTGKRGGDTRPIRGTYNRTLLNPAG